MARKPDEQFTELEAQRRAETALRAAFSTPHKPMKDIPRQRAKAKRKAKDKKS